MKKQTIKLSESQLHKVIKESVQKVLRESHVIAQQFGGTENPGSFESALVQAWKCASEGNKRTLESAFPEYFPSEAMYGNDNDRFDFREFPTKDAYDKHWADWQSRNR